MVKFCFNCGVGCIFWDRTEDEFESQLWSRILTLEGQKWTRSCYTSVSYNMCHSDSNSWYKPPPVDYWLKRTRIEVSPEGGLNPFNIHRLPTSRLPMIELGDKELMMRVSREWIGHSWVEDFQLGDGLPTTSADVRLVHKSFNLIGHDRLICQNNPKH